MECRTPRVKPNVNFGLGVIIMCHCRFILNYKCGIMMSNVGNRKVYAYLGPGNIWEIFLSSSYFVLNLKLL